jgi:hypothetical protein
MVALGVLNEMDKLIMSDDLLQKIKKTIEQSGYPLELQTGTVLERNGWVPFHSVEYFEPDAKILRELDILAYKIINGRRVELRISCKSSVNKQWVFFTTEKGLITPSDFKFTPVLPDHKRRWEIPSALKGLRFFSEQKEAINYTVLTGTNVDREGRSLLRDAILSSVSSIYHGPIPGGLLFDQRGTIYLFLVVFRGKLYEATLDKITNNLVIQESEYAQWRGSFRITDKYRTIKIKNSEGGLVPFVDALVWFGSKFRVEIISDSYLETYLKDVERVFSNLGKHKIEIFGKDWSEKNFPTALNDWPSLNPKEPDPAKSNS